MYWKPHFYIFIFWLLWDIILGIGYNNWGKSIYDAGVYVRVQNIDASISIGIYIYARHNTQLNIYFCEYTCNGKIVFFLVVIQWFSNLSEIWNAGVYNVKIQCSATIRYIEPVLIWNSMLNTTSCGASLSIGAILYHCLPFCIAILLCFLISR